MVSIFLYVFPTQDKKQVLYFFTINIMLIISILPPPLKTSSKTYCKHC